MENTSEKVAGSRPVHRPIGSIVYSVSMKRNAEIVGVAFGRSGELTYKLYIPELENGSWRSSEDIFGSEKDYLTREAQRHMEIASGLLEKAGVDSGDAEFLRQLEGEDQCGY